MFAKNTVLPSQAKLTREIGKTIVKGSDELLRILVVEGPADHHSSTNKPIGSLQIGGAQLSRDLMKGTEVDLTFEMSESRDLTVSAYFNGTGQQFSQVFKPRERAVDARLLASEILAVTGSTPSQRYAELAQRYGAPTYARIDAPADREQKARLAKLSADQVTATELAGEPITAKLTEAPGNGAALGGLKVTTENAWFAARPSGTEDVYKIYAESFRGSDHLAEVQDAAREVVNKVIA